MVEQGPFKPKEAGSIPAGPTKRYDMTEVSLRKDITQEELVESLSLLSLKICKLLSALEVRLGEDFLTDREKKIFLSMYRIANQHWESDDPDFGNLFVPEEIERLDGLR